MIGSTNGNGANVAPIKTNILPSITPASGVSFRNATKVESPGAISITMQFDLTSAKSNGDTIVSNMPTPPKEFVYQLAQGNPTDIPCNVNPDGTIRIGGRGAPTGTWYSLTYTYAI